jgi:small subunit ribosomal protein S14
MTTSDYKKVFKQLKVKQAKLKKYVKHNSPKERKTGFSLNKCRRCGRTRAHISKYGLTLCRQCFREIATKIGFKKYS